MRVRLGLSHTVGRNECGALALQFCTGKTKRAFECPTFTLVGKNPLKDHQVKAISLDQSEFSSLFKRCVNA